MPQSPDHNEYLRIAQNEATTTATIERQGTQIWEVYNSPARYLESTFSHLLRSITEGEVTHPLMEAIKARKIKKGSVYVLDVMGQGKFYADYPVDGEVANSLTNPRNEIEQLMDRQHGMEFVPGDITDPATQAGIDAYIAQRVEQMQGGFDFVFCRPKMGWSVVIPDAHAQDQSFVQFMQWHVTNTLFQRTHPDNGRLLLDYSWHTTKPEPLFETLKGTPGIDVQTDLNRMMLTRTPKAPMTLPQPQQITS